MATNIFSKLLRGSPFAPLQEHMAKVYACVKELVPFFAAVTQEDWDTAVTIQKTISRLEGEADNLKKNLRLNLPRGIMLPVSRRDLLEALTMQDKIANKAKDVAGLVVGRRMSFPVNMRSLLNNFVTRNIDAVGQAQKAINELDELVETGFDGHELDVVEEMIIKLHEIESDTDRMQVELRATLLAQEKDLPPIDVIFSYTVIESIGEVADRAERVGSRLQLMLAR
jgi:predicted phosphate transport protein (TIGR00153 family)